MPSKNQRGMTIIFSSMTFIKTNGINVHYQIHGRGETLILISGLGGDLTFWENSIEVLSKSYQVITFDTRGSGKTDAPDGPYSMEMLAADLLGLMDGLGIPKAHILGFSMGGAIALTFAHLYPLRTSKLILAATFAVLTPQVRLFLDAVLAVYEINRSPKQMFELIAPWLFSVDFLGRPENSAYLQYDENEPDPQSFEAWKSLYIALRQYNISGALPGISIPALIIAGDEDRLAHLHDARHLATGIPDSEIAIIPRAGHLINFEEPGLFHQLILDFLGS